MYSWEEPCQGFLWKASSGSNSRCLGCMGPHLCIGSEHPVLQVLPTSVQECGSISDIPPPASTEETYLVEETVNQPLLHLGQE